VRVIRPNPLPPRASPPAEVFGVIKTALRAHYAKQVE